MIALTGKKKKKKRIDRFQLKTHRHLAVFFGPTEHFLCLHPYVVDYLNTEEALQNRIITLRF